MMKMNTWPYAFLLLLSGMALRGSAQDLSEIYSPNLFLGTVDINIPIYEQGGIGARLSYNTKGVPVRELAGPAGLHWNLNAGGTIYRKIKGIPDEISYAASFTSGFESPEHEAVAGKYHTYRGRLNEALYDPDSRVFADPEADEFTFSAAGKYFTFMIGRDGQVFTNPKSKFEVYFYRAGAYRKPSDRSNLSNYGAGGEPALIKVWDKADNTHYYFSPSVTEEYRTSDTSLNPRSYAI